MKALILDDEIKLVHNHPLPAPAEGEALIRVTFAGICATDIELAKGYMGYRGVLGHEFVGVVEEAPEKSLIGKRVVGEINCPCGQCRECKAGLGNHCPNRTVLGILGRDGAFAEYLALPTKNLHLVPDNITDTQAMFTEPLAAGFQIVSQVRLTPNTKVAVIGDGRLGLLTAQALATSGAQVTAIGRSRPKLDILAKQGIATTLESELDAEKENYEIVVDATGAVAGLPLAIRLVQPLGTIVLKSTIAKRGEIDLNLIVINEITLVGSRCGPFDIALTALADGKIETDSMITAVMGLDEGVEAIEKATAKGATKILLEI